MKNVTSLMVNEHKLIIRMIKQMENRIAVVEAGGAPDLEFFADAVDFIRNYADRFHHAKEEDVLFRELEKNGMPRENSPIGAMLYTHAEGRGFVAAMADAISRAKKGDASAAAAIAGNGRSYAALLRNHIQIEDTVLYPLSERVLPPGVRDLMEKDYADAEATTPGLEAKYRGMVEKYEAKG